MQKLEIRNFMFFFPSLSLFLIYFPLLQALSSQLGEASFTVELNAEKTVFLKKKIVFSLLAALAIHCCRQAFPIWGTWEAAFQVAACRFFIVAASLAEDHGLWWSGLQQLWHSDPRAQFICSVPRGILLSQEWNPYLLYWQADY